MSIRPLHLAIGFVDWHTAVVASGAELRTRRSDAAARTALEHVERIVSDHLVASAGGSRFRVRLRLYTGWHEGTTRTPRFQGITKVKGTYASRVRTYHDGRVAFLGGDDGIQLGARLARAPDRLARKHGVHLLDTLRDRDGRPTEKMVDTALVVDLLGLANRREARRYVVVSDDDDRLPGIFAAEAMGANVGMLSRPGKSSRFMAHAAGLISTYGSVGPLKDSLLEEIADLQLFADPFEEFSKSLESNGWTAHFVRKGEEIAVRRESDGAIRTLRGPEKRKYRSLKGLLVSEAFANLERLASAQVHVTRSLTDPASGNLKEFLPSAGDIECGNESTELTFDSVCDILEQPEDRLRIFVVNGVAGVGKTHLIERIVRRRAAPASYKSGTPLLLHVESRGKVLTSLSDRIAGTLSSLRASFVEEELKPLIRRGAVQVAIDGFDELSDSRGYARAWGALKDFIRDLRGLGTCVLAGRDTMMDVDTVRGGLGNIVGADSITLFHVQHPLVEAGHSVLCAPAYALVQEMLAAKRDLDLPRALRKLDLFEVILLDDLGYVQQSPDEAEVLFTLLAERYERRSVMVTSNLVFSQWDRIFRDQMATAAAIDRLVHHSVVLEFDVPSFRTDPSRPTSPPSPPPTSRGRPPGPMLPRRRRAATS